MGVEKDHRKLDSCAYSIDGWVVKVVGHGLRLTIEVGVVQVVVQKSEVTVEKVMRIQVEEEIHLHQAVVVALRRIVLLQETGSLAEHRCRGPEQASSGQCKDDDRVVLQVDSLLA
jgi:hypothetical protein